MTEKQTMFIQTWLFGKNFSSNKHNSEKITEFVTNHNNLPHKMRIWKTYILHCEPDICPKIREYYKISGDISKCYLFTIIK